MRKTRQWLISLCTTLPGQILHRVSPGRISHRTRGTAARTGVRLTLPGMLPGFICMLACVACTVPAADGRRSFGGGDPRPDVLPVMLNKGLPFRYPPALYSDKVQGNVMLRLYIDKDGMIVNDSTRIAESSNVPALDSAAIKGAHDLRFVPAKLRGVPMAVSILFPVYFRHPEAPPPAGDSILKPVQPPTQPPATTSKP